MLRLFGAPMAHHLSRTKQARVCGTSCKVAAIVGFVLGVVRFVRRRNTVGWFMGPQNYRRTIRSICLRLPRGAVGYRLRTRISITTNGLTAYSVRYAQTLNQRVAIGPTPRLRNIKSGDIHTHIWLRPIAPTMLDGGGFGGGRRTEAALTRNTTRH